MKQHSTHAAGSLKGGRLAAGASSAWASKVRSTVAIVLLALVGIGAAKAAQVTLKVVSARAEPKAFGGVGVAKGAPVGSYKFLVNIDNTGTTVQRSPAPGTGCSPQDAGYPGSCAWTSIAGAASSSPVYTQGSQANVATALANVPDGRYLVSVLADGYKLDGRHFTVSGSTVSWEGKKTTAPADPASEVRVELQPTPLPDAQIKAAVFEDVSPVNSAPDLPAEHGLAGFQGHILDVLGEVTTNVYGDPLCSKYDASGELIAGSGGTCLSKCYAVNNSADVGTVAPLDVAGRCPVDVTLANGNPRPLLEGGFVPAGAAIEGKVKIPNLGPNRYTLTVTPPDGSGWVQTTTLEGSHDWDAWVMEGATGLDTEFIIAGEPFPAIIFGYVPAPGTPSAVGSALPSTLAGDSSITGVVEAVKIYVPTTTGVAGLPGEIWGGLQGAKIDKPIAYPWVTLTNLGNGDTIVWAGQGDANGRFTIPNVPAGTYTLTWWDEPQNQILDLVNVTIGASENLDMGILPLSGWWTFFDGYVFNDTNRNGVKDPGEPGLSGYTLTMRRRDNSLMDRGSTAVTTDANGYYKFEAGYPMTQWLVMEAYDDLHYTTGVTYQADNQPTPTTVVGAGVDVSVHPIIGLSGRMDWGKHAYDATGANGVDPRNGGIVGTVSYDTTRNELDPRYAAVEDWQPSISNLVVNLFKPVPAVAGCRRLPAPGATCDSTGRYALASDGSIARGLLLNTYLTETWQRPKSCIARDADGNPLVHGVQEKVLPTDDVNGECIEAPLMGVQFGTYATDAGTPDANFGATVDGNYGFGDGCFNGTLDATDPSAPVCTGGTFETLPSGDYLVQVDLRSQLDTLGSPIYKVTREEDINIANGDEFIPAVPPSVCAGPLHTVDVAGIGADGANATVNPTFVGIGGSPYEGQSRALCDTKLVTLANGKSIAPAFNLFTDVPVPGRHWFIIIDDLNFSSNSRSVTFGEKAGMPFVPVGIYDYTDRLIKTVESDYNGLADVLLPSTNRISCPTPSGVCANLYRFVGNDPGVPGRLNLNYNPGFRTIAAEFEVMPGQIIPGRSGADAGRCIRSTTGRADDVAGGLQARRRTAEALCGRPTLWHLRPGVHAHRPRIRRQPRNGHGPDRRGRPAERLGPRQLERHRDHDHGADDRQQQQPLHARGSRTAPDHGPGGQRHVDCQRADVSLPAQQRQQQPELQPADFRGRPGQDLCAGRNAAGLGQPRDPERARCRDGLHHRQQQQRRPRRPGGRLSELADGQQPAPEPARCLLREPDHHQQREAAGHRPGQPRRLGARLDHRRRRLRRRQRCRDRLADPHRARDATRRCRQRGADLGRQRDRL